MNVLRFRDLLKGWNFSPIVVGIVRGAIEAGVLATLGVLSVELSTLDWGQYAAFSPVVLLGLRTIEAQADQIIDPKQNRTAERRAGDPPQ